MGRRLKPSLGTVLYLYIVLYDNYFTGEDKLYKNKTIQ